MFKFQFFLDIDNLPIQTVGSSWLIYCFNQRQNWFQEHISVPGIKVAFNISNILLSNGLGSKSEAKKQLNGNVHKNI